MRWDLLQFRIVLGVKLVLLGPAIVCNPLANFADLSPRGPLQTPVADGNALLEDTYWLQPDLPVRGLQGIPP